MEIQLDRLPSMSWSERARLPNCVAVYLVLSGEGEVLYVGRTDSLVIRWRQHHIAKRLTDILSVRIAWIEIDPTLAKSKEQSLINHFKPPFNSRLEAKQPPKFNALVMFRVRPDVPSDVRLARRLRLAAKLTGVSMSGIMRQATDARLDELAKRYPELEAA